MFNVDVSCLWVERRKGKEKVTPATEVNALFHCCDTKECSHTLPARANARQQAPPINDSNAMASNVTDPSLQGP